MKGVSSNLLEELNVEFAPTRLIIDEGFWSKFLNTEDQVDVSKLKDYYRRIYDAWNTGDRRRSRSDVLVMKKIVDCVGQGNNDILSYLRSYRIDYKKLSRCKSNFFGKVFQGDDNGTWSEFRKSNIGEFIRCLSYEIDRHRNHAISIKIEKNKVDLFFKSHYYWNQRNTRLRLVNVTWCQTSGYTSFFRPAVLNVDRYTAPICLAG